MGLYNNTASRVVYWLSSVACFIISGSFFYYSLTLKNTFSYDLGVFGLLMLVTGSVLFFHTYKGVSSWGANTTVILILTGLLTYVISLIYSNYFVITYIFDIIVKVILFTCLLCSFFISVLSIVSKKRKSVYQTIIDELD